MRNGKKFLLLTLPAIFCLMGMLLAACGSGTVPGRPGSGSQTKAPTSQQVFRWAFRLPDIASFDPGIA
ncbi:MAG TPA: hypothetical protein VFB12_06245 [Ktedonobacteraceae bacterium]|nr:hypothetical protein [Ktedonobacteraceae bacterium]